MGLLAFVTEHNATLASYLLEVRVPENQVQVLHHQQNTCTELEKENQSLFACFKRVSLFLRTYSPTKQVRSVCGEKLVVSRAGRNGDGHSL